MKAVILTAGKGTRLKPLTDEIPKGLISVNNKPILEYSLNSIYTLVDEIILVVGYKQEKIKEYFKDSFKGIPIKYVTQQEQLGTGHALLCAKKYLDESFIVLNGDDIYSSQDLKQLITHDFAILSHIVENPQSFGVLIGETYLEKIIEKPQKFISNKINTGVYVLTPKIFDQTLTLSTRGEYEIVDYLNYIIEQTQHNIVIELISKYWIPINNFEQLEFAENFFSKK